MQRMYERKPPRLQRTIINSINRGDGTETTTGPSFRLGGAMSSGISM
jgi:hypothetical protein